VNKRDCHAPLTARRCNPLDRAQSDVTACKDAGRAGLEKVGVTVIRPTPSLLHIVIREDISTFVQAISAGSHSVSAIGTYESEQPAAFMSTHLTARSFEDVYRRQVAVAVDGIDSDRNCTPVLDFDRSCSVR
jgi:hypothetical protein